MMRSTLAAGERVVGVELVDVVAVDVRDDGDVHGLVDRGLLREGGQDAPVGPSWQGCGRPEQEDVRHRKYPTSQKRKSWLTDARRFTVGQSLEPKVPRIQGWNI